MTEDSQKSLYWDEDSHEEKQPIKRGKNYLLLIGIDEYKHVAKLQNPVKDALDLKNLLVNKFHFEKSRIVELFNEKATYEGIDQSLRLLSNKIKPEDSLIIYFSGHGHYDEWYKEGFWIPVEARYQQNKDYFPYTYLVRAIKNINSRHTFVIADSCYSGAVLVGPTKNIKDQREKDPSRWLLASGRNEVVRDGIAGGNSPFAKELIDTLSLYSEEGISVLTLVDKVTRATMNNSRQKPIGRAIQDTGDKGGQFIFHPRHTKISFSDSKPKIKTPDTGTREVTKKQPPISPGQGLGPNGEKKKPFWKEDYIMIPVFMALFALLIYILWPDAENNEIPISQAESGPIYQPGLQGRNAKAAKRNEDFLVKFSKENKKKEPDPIEEQIPTENELKYAKAIQEGDSLSNIEDWKGAKIAYERANEISSTKEVVDKIKICETRINDKIYKDNFNKAQNTENLKKKLAFLKNALNARYTSVVSNLIDSTQKEIDEIPWPQLQKVSGGTFKMGSDKGNPDEKNIHDVTIRDFYIGIYEVTNEEYCAFLNQKNPLSSELKDWINLDGKHKKEKCRIRKRSTGYEIEKGYEKHPVIYISWNGAVAYCDWGGYRLPTEAEWEYAAGGGNSSRTTYSGTSNKDSLKYFAVYGKGDKGNTERVSIGRKNTLGLFNMSGNVWEWCYDWYDSYPTSAQENPNGPISGLKKVRRGGNWSSSASECRVANRYMTLKSYKFNFLGFRVAQ